MNRWRWKITGEGEFDLKWLVQWLLRIAGAVLAFLAAMVAGGKIVIHL